MPQPADAPQRTWLIAAQMMLLALLLYGSLLPYGAYIQAAAGVIAAPVVLVVLVRPIARRLYLHPAVVIAVPLFAALLVPAVLLPIAGEYGMEKVTDLATLSLFTALAASLVRDRRHLAAFARVWLIVGAAVALLALLGGESETGRAVGAGANPIGLGRGVATATIAAAWLMFNSHLRYAIGVPLCVMYFVAMFATGSKGPVLAVVLAVALLVLLDSRRWVRRAFQMTAVTVAGYLTLTTVPALRDSRVGEFVLSPTTVQDPIRDGALDATWYALTHHGLSGHGYGSWSFIARFPLMDYPHNIWAELAIEAGALATALVAGLLLFVALRLWQARNPYAALVLAWLLADTVSASLSGDIRARTLWFFIVLGYVVTRWAVSTEDDPHAQIPNTDPGVSKNKSSNVVASSHP